MTLNTQLRPLAKTTIGLSISEAETSALVKLGLTPSDVNEVTVELSRRLVSLGARIVLGHQWRPGGVMEAVSKFAQVYQPESPGSIVHNYLAYPDRAALSAVDRKRLSGVVTIHDGDDRPALPRPLALSRMREEMARVINASIALCGSTSRPEGRIPGVIEETAIALRHGRPVYISAMMGGAAELLTQVFRGDRSLLVPFASQAHDQDRVPLDRSYIGRMLEPFERLDMSTLAELCGLRSTELEELFDAQNVDTVLHLTVTGLNRRLLKD